jgi:hypothetical protein
MFTFSPVPSVITLFFYLVCNISWFIFPFPYKLTLNSFQVAICHPVSSLLKCAEKSILFFFSNWVNYHCVCFYILDRSPLSDTWFSNIFSQSIARLFILLIVLLCRAKLLSFDEAQLIRCCMCCASKNSLLGWGREGVELQGKGAAQEVEHLPCKYEALSSNSLATWEAETERIEFGASPGK